VVSTYPVPICYSCYYLEADGLGMTCAAYPNGIPTEILESEVDHRLPYTGDNGIQFKQNPDRLPPDLTVFEGEP
jgi:hypothetical protein